MLNIQFPVLLKAYISMTHLSQLMNKMWYIIQPILKSTLHLDFISFYLTSFFYNLIQDTPLHLVIMSPEAPLNHDSLSLLAHRARKYIQAH